MSSADSCSPPKIVDGLHRFPCEIERPPLDQPRAVLGRWYEYGREIKPAFPSAYAGQHGLGINVGVVLPRQYLRLAADHEQPLEPVAAESVKLALEPLPVLTHATANQVRDRLALDAEKVLQAGNRIVARLQRASDRGQPLKASALRCVTE